MDLRIQCLCVDTTDPARLAGFWQSALGWRRSKNRLHLDLRPADQAAEVARLEALGARRVDVGQGEVSWVVMADPDGNEFDVLRPLDSERGGG